MVFHYDSSDPLAVVTAPPPNETPAERAAREEREAEAQRISDQIDDELRADKVALKKEEQMVKVLLLGQSESGKSISISDWVHIPPPSTTASHYSGAQGNLLLSRVSDSPSIRLPFCRLIACVRFSYAIRKG